MLLAGSRSQARTDAAVLAPLDASRVAAARWLANRRPKVSVRDLDLLRRAQDVFYQNILTAGEEDKALPWAPLRGICLSTSKYRGIWNWDGRKGPTIRRERRPVLQIA